MSKEPKKSTLADDLISLSELDKHLVDLDEDARVRTLRKQVAKLHKKLEARETGLDLLKDAFVEAYSEPLDIQVPRYSPKSSKAKTLEIPILHITDVHFGKRTATYNIAIAEDRMRLLGEKTIRLVELRRSVSRIDELHIFLGGDFGEGEGAIFPGQALEIDQDVVGQLVKEGPRIMCEQILLFLGHFKRLVIKAVPGNHGRVSRFAAKRNNFDNWFYLGLRQMVDNCLSTKDRARIEWDLPFDRPAGSEWYVHHQTFDFGHMLVHGDQIRGQLGFPWYGVGKKLSGWADLVPDFSYLWMGHFHTQAAYVINKRMVLAGGTPESSNAYAAESLAAGGDPVQRLAFFEKEHGLIVDAPISLKDTT
jgi:hypothetical protein